MIINTRQECIIDLVSRNGFCRAEDLAERLGVSAITIRRDLGLLGQRQLVRRVRGGAMPMPVTVASVPLPLRLAKDADAKRAIAAHAVGLIEPNDVIFLDAGSTCYYLARRIPDDCRLTVITHSLENANVLRGKAGVRVICPGGELDDTLGSFVGPIAEEIIGRFRIDKAFIGTSGIDLRMGCVNDNLLESGIKARAHASARRSYLVADASKFGARGIYSVIPTDRLQVIITDSGVDDACVRAFRERGVEVVVTGTDAETGSAGMGVRESKQA